ncbi:hypothetical protein [Hymenobacter terrenus]|nr:hypothetical protein [Hymenobacter terrenus]
MIAVQGQALAHVYTVEFEEMWGSSTATAPHRHRPHQLTPRP